MGIAGQTFVIFILVMIIAFLISIGINYSVQAQIERTNPKAKEAFLAIAGKGEDSAYNQNEILHDIRKFEKLGGPDIIANKAAIDEISDRLYHKIDTADLSDQTRANLRQDVDRIQNNLYGAIAQ